MTSEEILRVNRKKGTEYLILHIVQAQCLIVRQISTTPSTNIKIKESCGPQLIASSVYLYDDDG